MLSATTTAAGIATWSLDGPMPLLPGLGGEAASRRIEHRVEVPQAATLSVVLPESARGPLAQRCIKLLGLGPDGQAIASSVAGIRDGRPAGRSGADTVMQTWLSARILPTPKGAIRSAVDMPVWVHAPVQGGTAPAGGPAASGSPARASTRLDRWKD